MPKQRKPYPWEINPPKVNRRGRKPDPDPDPDPPPTVKKQDYTAPSEETILFQPDNSPFFVTPTRLFAFYKPYEATHQFSIPLATLPKISFTQLLADHPWIEQEKLRLSFHIAYNYALNHYKNKKK